MDITFKTLKNESFKTVINDSQTFEEQLDHIKECVGVSENDTLKLIYAGRVLELNKSPLEYCIRSGDTIIIMKQKPPAVKKPSTSASSSNENVNAYTPSEPQSVMSHLSDAIVSNMQSQNANGNQSNGQQSNQNASQHDFWNNANSTDTAQNYSVEQVHAIIPAFFQYILHNPNLKLLILTNPDLISEVLVGGGFRLIIRQLLQQSPTIVDSIRNGTSANIVLGQQQSLSNGQNSASEQNNDENGENNEDEDEDEDEDNEDEDNEDEDNEDDEGGGINVQEEQLTDEDNIKIQELTSITGCQEAMAKHAYESSKKNMEVAASLIMQFMDN